LEVPKHQGGSPSGRNLLLNNIWSSNNKGKKKPVLYMKEIEQEVTSYVQGKAQW
jgi:hypothetical protein